jgi:hypothetical protein
MVHELIDRISTSIRLASVDEVLSAKAYLCFVSRRRSCSARFDSRCTALLIRSTV